jgi:DNA-binding transcriptional LysR family regulator
MMLRQITYFVCVVDCDSFTLAAKKCNVTQSAISQQVKTLESELGAKLFVKKGGKIVLTPAGKYFYNVGTEIMDKVEEIRENVRFAEDGGECG